MSITDREYAALVNSCYNPNYCFSPPIVREHCIHQPTICRDRCPLVNPESKYFKHDGDYIIPLGYGKGQILCKRSIAVNSFSWICDCHPGVRWGLKDSEQIWTDISSGKGFWDV